MTFIGHGWPRTIPNNNHCLLSWCYGLYSHVRHHKRREFQFRSRLVSTRDSPAPFFLNINDMILIVNSISISISMICQKHTQGDTNQNLFMGQCTSDSRW